jgi:hypothetical protein
MGIALCLLLLSSPHHWATSGASVGKSKTKNGAVTRLEDRVQNDEKRENTRLTTPYSVLRNYFELESFLD